MLLNRWLTSALVIVASGIAGCATPPPIPAAPSPADLIRAIPQGNNTTVVNVQPQSNHQTLPDFLGITRCCYATIGCCNTARDQAAFCFPGLAGAIDPGAGVPSLEEAQGAPPGGPVATAAAIKAKEGEAQAKIAALRYLAEIGCGVCGHPPYTEVEGAFIAALNDCTEEVRFEALLALRTTTCGGRKHHCVACGGKACCSAKIQEKVMDMAYGIDDDEGCPNEPSERVRRKARLVLRACGPPMVEATPAAEAPPPAEGPPAEGPPAPIPPQGEGAPSVPPPDEA